MIHQGMDVITFGPLLLMPSIALCQLSTLLHCSYWLQSPLWQYCCTIRCCQNKYYFSFWWNIQGQRPDSSKWNALSNSKCLCCILAPNCEL